jgi:hypothetical protein
VTVVNEFPDVFPKELSGRTLDRDINFVIELVLDTSPIYKTPYRMVGKQLSELEDSIKELLQKGYIHPSSPP